MKIYDTLHIQYLQHIYNIPTCVFCNYMKNGINTCICDKYRIVGSIFNVKFFKYFQVFSTLLSIGLR